MEIKTTNVNFSSNSQDTKSSTSNQESGTKFSEELKELKASKETDTKEAALKENDSKEIESKEKDIETEENKKNKTFEIVKKEDHEQNKNINNALKDLNTIVEKLNQSDENKAESIKDNKLFTDSTNMINNDYNIQDKDILPQMNPSMNFSGDGQPFSSFLKDEQGNKQLLSSSTKDLAEEAAIMSTMAENIAIANRNTILKEERMASIEIKNEQVVKFDSIIMSQADVEVFVNLVQKEDVILNQIPSQADAEVFVNLVQKEDVNLNQLTSQNLSKSIQISKTLADMLVKSKENNQPLRIDFDNNISVIIRISRDGKISADFLPSSQVAEAYLKENLPLLRQRFDDNNIEYDSLNQRERREQQKDKQQRERSQR
ncbi:MAG: hypothetical protein E7Z92_00655 [Cyanobacteria bacterium SIG31]|nr:hypothetical protein [Cyanobacteria bacterium SIG31]